MSETGTTLPVHTLLEATCVLTILPCEKCGGTFSPDEADIVLDDGTLVVTVACSRCRTAHVYRFNVASLRADRNAPAKLPPLDADEPINRTTETSAALDVWDWIALSSLLQERARSAGLTAGSLADRARVRRLGVAASKCLGEALKFYRDDNELPPETALFHEHSREIFREHPEWFARRRLIRQRTALPAVPPTRS